MRWVPVVIGLVVAVGVVRAADPPADKFERFEVEIKPPGLSNRMPEAIRVSADGKCLYEQKPRPAANGLEGWAGVRLVHTIPAARVKELASLLEATDWLAKEAKPFPALHNAVYSVAVTRGGKRTAVTLQGEAAGYEKLVRFVRSVADQENMLYRLEHLSHAEAARSRTELDALVSDALGEPFAKSPLTIDLNRFAPWAVRIVRDPGGDADDVRAAVRLVGLLKLESERDYLTDLSNDRDLSVRGDVARAVGRLGGPKAVPVLRKMLRRTSDAAWELIKLGEVARPAVVEVIRTGEGHGDIGYEHLIRAYIDHWADVPKPLSVDIIEAVRTSQAKWTVRAHRTGTPYHAELLALTAGKK